MAQPSQRVAFNGARGAQLAGRLDLPAGPIRAYAVFAHCFTCSKDTVAARHISSALADKGIAVLRFDFTGLGGSGGDFASTNFSSNLEDLKRAADFLTDFYEAPKLLIGHSLGGAAVLAIARNLPSVKAIATIGAPNDVRHVLENFDDALPDIAVEGERPVVLGGRRFTIRQQFVDDLDRHAAVERVGALHTALLILHAPRDEIVGIDHATRIFVAAKHPKSFVSLDTADHLLSNPADAAYAAQVIAAWSGRYIEKIPTAELPSAQARLENADVCVSATGQGLFQTQVQVGRFSYIADEPRDVGGLGSGPSPYGFLSAALATCTAMTMRLYAKRKGLSLSKVDVRVAHDKTHAADCVTCLEDQRAAGGKIDRFKVGIHLEGDLKEDARKRLLEIADRCPVHRTLENGATFEKSEF